MAVRQFGPTLGAGVVVKEREPSPAILPAALGVAALIGTFERGVANDLTYAPNKAALRRRLGGRVGSDATTGASVTPDCAQDYFDHGGGAGELVCLRVTDGNEQVADLKLYSRHWGTAFEAAESDKDSQSQIKTAVIQLKAFDGGRWGGRARRIRAEVSNINKIGTTTLDTEATMLANEWKGATLTLDAVSGKTYKVLSNNTAGVLTVETGATMSADMGVNTDKGYALVLATKVERTGMRKALTAKVIQAQIDPANEFGLEIYVDGEKRLTYPDLSMDSASARYFKKVINEDSSNYEVEAVDLWNATTPLAADIRPANFYGMPTAVDTESITFLPLQVVSIEDAAVAVVGVEFGASYDGPPIKLTFTWVNATNKYTVVCTGLYGQNVIENLPDFTVGAGEQINKIYDPSSTHAQWLKLLPKITIDHTGGAPADTKKFVVEIMPLPGQVVGGYVLPDAKNKPLTRIRVRSTTFRKVTLDGDPSSIGLAPVQAVVTGTAAEGAGYAVVLGNNDKLKLQIDGRKVITVTLTAGANQTAQNIVDDIHTAFDAVFGAGVLNPASVYTDAAGDKFVRLSSTWYEGGGKASVVDVQAQATHGYTLLGLTVATTKGTNGKEAQLEFAEECWGGYDGATPADADYLAALAIGSSPLNKVAHDKGVLLIGCPDVTSTTVQQAGQDYAEAKAHLFHILIPAAKVNEQDAVDYINTTIGRSEDCATFFPSYGDVKDPDKDGVLKRIPHLGAVFGLDAKFAREFGHYCRPAAGTQAELARVVALPTGDVQLDEEILNPQGVNVVKFRSNIAIVWGARTLAGQTGEKFRSKRLQLSHYVHTLLARFDDVVFSLNDSITQKELHTRLREFFQKEWRKRALKGATFDDACQIKIDAENNTEAEAEAGNLHAEISLSITGFAERVIFSIGKMGLGVDASA